MYISKKDIFSFEPCPKALELFEKRFPQRGRFSLTGLKKFCIRCKQPCWWTWLLSRIVFDRASLSLTEVLADPELLFYLKKDIGWLGWVGIVINTQQYQLRYTLINKIGICDIKKKLRWGTAYGEWNEEAIYKQTKKEEKWVE